MKKKLLSFVIIQILLGCSSKREVFSSNEYVKNTNGFDILIQQFAHNIDNIWGNQEILITGPKDYVKYTDQYQTRSHINFDNGNITIETISKKKPKECLKKNIITTLLMGVNSKEFNFYSDINLINISKKPFLYGQVLDQTNKPILQEWHAVKFSNYLLKNKLQKRKSGLHVIWLINIQLMPNNIDKRAHKYLPYIRKSAAKYGIDESLILAIMQIESNFNPYAVSSSDALGLMQIMPHYAGRDVFHAQGKLGIPSRNYLFNPANNIDLGAAYLSLLQNTYLGEITNVISQRYAIITAYHGGSDTVLKVFHNDKKRAVQIINQMLPKHVYQKLVTNHPAMQSRNYLVKVNNAQRKYR
ncbi:MULTISPECIES: membrane-bound lytic murein transglycosylase MltC [Arsenophonus]|uniref:membrane-bound lytic murein transglycosylase MltC n=1 Tax=Arsenophonus TaxID=637 RepID=UPI0012FEEB43|nr:membrane-bound lytic murein transglycosylase MltC [Candidatus Arsenophonus lipoptenae]